MLHIFDMMVFWEPDRCIWSMSTEEIMVNLGQRSPWPHHIHNSIHHIAVLICSFAHRTAPV